MKLKSITTRLGAIMAAGFLLCTVSTAHATLIGDTVTMHHRFSNIIIPPGPFNVVVQAGTGDVFQPYNPGLNFYEVDMEANSFSVLYLSATDWAASTFNSLIITDMDWIGGPGILTGVTISTNLAGFDNSRVTFTDDSVSINWQGLSFGPGTRWDIGLITTHIAEPGTFAILGLGFAGLGLARRRKAAA